MKKQGILSSNRLYILKLLYRALRISNIYDIIGVRRKPRTIQLPVTSRCNSRCQTCNVWKERERVDIDPKELNRLFQNKYFDEVTSVGINGGEVTLIKNFEEILDAILVLPKLQNIYIISNGLLPDKLFELLRTAKVLCDNKGVLLNFTLSVDGYGHTHELIRGVPNCFTRTKQILDEFKRNKSVYASNISIGSTISKNNIANIIETECFLNEYPFPVQYHLAVPNNRIHTLHDYDYYVIKDKQAMMLAAEYFYSKFLNTKGDGRYSSFCQYIFLRNEGKKRLCRCNYRYQDITIDENLYLYLCATASPKISDLKEKSIKDSFRSKEYDEAIRYIKHHCDACIHYISETPTLRGWFLFVKELIQLRFDWAEKFKILS